MTARAVFGTQLSPREEQILRLIRTTDLSYFSIGRELPAGPNGTHMTANTVATHAQRAFQRLGVCGRVGYLRKVAQDGE